MSTNYIDFPINPLFSTSVEGGINDPEEGLFYKISVPKNAGGEYQIFSSGLPLYAVLYQEDTSVTILPKTGAADGSFVITATLFGNTNYELFVMTPSSSGGTFDLTCECLHAEPERNCGEELPMSNSSSHNYAADPVDISRGAYTAKYDLLRFGGGQNLCFSACYDSAVPVAGVMGKGWYHNFEKRIAATAMDSSGCVYSLRLYETPQNFLVFDLNESGEYVCRTPGKEHYHILHIDEGFRVSRHGQGYEDYNTKYYGGKLMRIVNHQGQSITLNHDTANVIKIYDDLTGKHLRLNMRFDGKLQSVQDVYGRSVFFDYDSDGNLLEFVDLNGQKFKFHYTDDRMIAQYKLKDFNNFTAEYLSLMNFYSSDGKITCQESSSGLAAYFGYDENGEHSFTNRNGDESYRTYNSLGLMTSYTDENGNTTTYTYDAAGNMLTETDALGKTRTMEYNANHQPTKIIDKNGNVTTMTYDEKGNGNITSITYPNGGKEKFVYYDGTNLLKNHTDLNGMVTVYTYDHQGRMLTKKEGDRPACTYTYTGGLLTRETDAKGNATTYTYDEFGFMTSKTDALNRTTTFAYDNAGNLLRVTDPLNNTTVYEYDKDGLKISETDANGRKTRYGYNGDALLSKVTFPDNTSVSYSYDRAERLTSITDQMGRMTNINCDMSGRVLSKQFPDGGTVSYTYDAVGNVLTETNPLGGVTTRTYDGMGNVLTETIPDGVETSFTYDNMGRVTFKNSLQTGSNYYSYSVGGLLTYEEDDPGRAVYRTYDIYGNKISERIGNDETHVSTFTYDANNNLLTATDRLGNTTAYEYDACNQCVKVTDALNHSTAYGYDPCGRRTTVTDARGNTVTTAYDKVGNVLSVTDAKGNVILSKTYNNRNLPTIVTDANGTRTYAYNALGKPVSVTDAIGTKQFAYDSMGHNSRVTDEAEGVSTTAFDKLGNPTSLTGPGGASTVYTYDNMGRMTSKTTPSGGTVTYCDFYLGQPGKMVDACGNVHQYGYNVHGQMCSHTAPSLSETYTYDLEGNLLTSSDGHHTVTRTYDEMNRMTSYVEGDVGIIQYSYDSVGNLFDMNGPYTMTYTYDANNNLVNATDHTHNVSVSYTYDENNKLSTETKPDGSVTTYTYDDFQRLASKIARTSAGDMIIGYEYTYDARGRLATEKDLVKNKMMCYTYDNRDWVTNRRTVDLVTEEYTDDPFAYDAAGNLQNLIGDDTPTYDSNNRLTEYKGVTLDYDADGNMQYHSWDRAITPSYMYDVKNRLMSDQIEFSASYNADNLRYRVTDRDDINLYDHTYLSDTNYRLSRALVRYDNYANNATYYLHGLGLVGECETDDLDFKTYHYDYRGSTVAITDASGNITDTFEYDTYGKQTARTGNTDTPFRYNGRDGVMTEYNGLLYMRARYYSPDMRRFISADILPGGIDNAVTLNRYAYANANPVTNIDPFGLCAEGGASSSASVYNELPNYIQLSLHQENRRPYTGEPGSTYRAPNGDTRTYGPDGTPATDYDHDDHGFPDKHPHDEDGGHHHDWEDGVRGPAYLWDVMLGTGIIVVCVLGYTYIVANDIVGVGVIDDFLLVPLTTFLGKGVAMIAGR